MILSEELERELATACKLSPIEEDYIMSHVERAWDRDFTGPIHPYQQVPKWKMKELSKKDYCIGI